MREKPGQILIKITSILFVVFISSSVLGAYPTPEGLFRYDNERDFTGDLILLDLRIRQTHSQLSSQDFLSRDYKSSELDGHIRREEQKNVFVQLILAPREERLELLQVVFDRPGFEEEDAISSRYFSNFNRFMNEQVQTNKILFYSLMTMYAINSDEQISNLLQRSVAEFKTNEQLLNREKEQLLKDYKDYLEKAQKREEQKKELDEDIDVDGEDKREELVSPLRPEDEEKREKVNKIMNSPMYKKDEAVKLIKEGRRFYWTLEYENFQAKFSNENQRLKTLALHMTESPIRLRARNYTTIGGQKTLPQFIDYVTSQGEHYEIQFLNYRRLRDRGERLSRMAREYAERIKNKDHDVESLKYKEIDFLY